MIRVTRNGEETEIGPAWVQSSGFGEFLYAYAPDSPEGAEPIRGLTYPHVRFQAPDIWVVGLPAGTKEPAIREDWHLVPLATPPPSHTSDRDSIDDVLDKALAVEQQP